MEMDMKLRQELSSKQKLVSFDSNNNNSNKSNGEEDNNGNKQTSDEDWRSLSPNEEPTKNDINKNIINDKKRQVVSAKLICEKLRDYQATDEATLAERRAGKFERSKNVTAKDAMQNSKQQQQNGFNSKHFDHDSQDQKPDNGHDDYEDSGDGDKCESHVPKNANGHNEEIQLMSIDPTLCHSSENISGIKNSNISNSESNNLQISSSSSITAAAAAVTATEDTNDINNSNEREEQTVNEEFSSSNSSFGPMSMSMPRQEDFLSDNQDLVSNNQDQQVSDTEDEPNSTQSGSVLTVINTKLDQNKSGSNKNVSSLNDNQKSLSWNGSSPDQNTLTSEINEVGEEEGMDDDMINRQDQDGNISEDDGGEKVNEGEKKDEDEEGGSNIGVAFESLQFDYDIKSSKQEQVDDELLIAPTPVKRPTASKFNANEVRSVCNFISAAISDATRQVENYMNLGSNHDQPTNSSHKDVGSTDNYHQDVNDQENSKRNSSASSIQRATFVRESPEFNNSSSSLIIEGDQDLLDNMTAQDDQVTGISEQGGISKLDCLLSDTKQKEEEIEDEQDDLNGNEGVEVPTADLSSIFEANVRREIERFETNSTIKKSNGCKYANKNTLTEWRIAEEIRLFNAREMELKKRFEADTGRSNGNGNGDTNNGLNGQQQIGNVLDSKLLSSSPATAARQNQQHEAVVRFGKTLQIPKASSTSDTSSSSISSSSSSSTSMNNLAKSIKLSTTAISSNTNTQKTTVISMHKFIASGGKRFVFTNTNNNNNNSSSNQNSSNTTPVTTTLQNNLFTKSMSNLSTSSNKNDLQSRVVDYKAIDSLKCKETPNVKPGIARKVIETFSRMQSSQDSLSSRVNESSQSNVIPTPNSTAAATTGTTNRQYLQPQHQMSSSSCSSNSAEWKIQEELREMRAREAELRDQRSHMVNSSLQISHTNNQDYLTSNDLYNGDSSENHLNIDSTINGKQTTTDEEQQPHKESLSLSFSSECLYPIKQTIDSFRKMNSSSQQATTTNSNFAMSTSHQNNNNCLAKIQKKTIQVRTEQENISSDDYVSE